MNAGLVARVRDVLDHTTDGVDRGARVLLAVSGGRDSVALLHLVAAARPDLDLVVGHVRHGLRDDAADADAARANAAALEAAYCEADATPGDGAGPEDSARRARWAALTSMAGQVGAVAVLAGHTMDDQAETVLLRIARGTGPAGLAGMGLTSTAHGVAVLRPLLTLRRDAVRAVALPHPWVEDPTNTDDDQRRARARHQVLPALRRLHPSEADVVPLLARLADLARTESEGLDAVTDRITLWRYGPAVLVPRHTGAVPSPPAVQARLLRRGWMAVDADRRPPSHQVVAAALALSHGRSLSGPGDVRITASDRGWVVCPPVTPPPDLALDVGGRVSLGPLGVELTCEAGVATGPGEVPSSQVVLGGGGPPQLADLHLPWTVEVTATPPLRISWRGADGARDARPLLQQLVPHGLRHLVPLVHDAAGRLVADGHRAVDPPRPGSGCLRLVGYPAGP